MSSRLLVGVSQLKQKWTVRKERRQIIALGAAGAFLLFSFWNSFQNHRLKSDLQDARLEEKIQSGRMYLSYPEADSAAVVVAEIDEHGHLRSLSGDPGIETSKLTFTPMKINNIARGAKLPLTVPLDLHAHNFSQLPDSEISRKSKTSNE